MSNQQKTVVVGMSGGVDSSVTALLLKEQGYKVIGVFMKNWEETDENGHCHAAAEYLDVIAVCEQIGIPYYSVNFAKEYWDLVFARCLTEYAAGYTPNPDILCNQEIKFKLFFNKALSLGADYLATGHYCKKLQLNGVSALGTAADQNKDQTYFLYTVKSSTLDKVLFPLGDLMKPEVKKIAHDRGLITAAKKESMGICFIGKRDFKEFLSKYCPKKPGDFETEEGLVVGRHDGVPFYTIGQRRGLGIGGMGDAWFVVSKDVDRNVVVVSQGAETKNLYRKNLTARDLSWVGVEPQFPLFCSAKVRYRQEVTPCVVDRINDQTISVEFTEMQRAITPCQSIVFYKDSVCLGGGIIAL